MIRQFIGSSNVYRNYKHCDFPDYPNYKTVNCTSREVFLVALDNIGSGNGEVIIGVLENFLCNSVKDMQDPEEMNTALEKTINDYLETVKYAAIKMPNIKFALAQPTLRPAYKWYTECHETFCKKSWINYFK
jgi:hypothetical protein